MPFKKIHLEPKNKTFADVMGSGKDYKVPPFQRDYSWQEEQLNELWQDIENMHKQNAQHFMGYLVLQSKDDKSFEIIDGQQRLTTITLMIIAALSRFQQLIYTYESTKDNEQRCQHYHATYLGVFDPLKLETSMKLTLNRNNNSHYVDIINSPYQVPRQKNITSTNRNLNKTLIFFQKKIETYNGEKLAEFIGGLADGLLFTTITVKDNLNAHLVFKTLNARGAHLSEPDLLKNYLLSVMAIDIDPDNQVFQKFNESWSNVLQQLGGANFTAFLRSYHDMSNRLRHKKNLYHMLKKEITKSKQVMPYLQDITRYAATYAALQKPDDSFWKDYGDSAYTKCVDDLRTLKLFNIKTPLSFLMTAYDKFSARDFVKITHWVVIISVRYNVICRKVANDQAIIYNSLANKVMKKETLSLADLREGLMPIYPKDEEFVSAFTSLTMPSRTKAKRIVYLLQQIENHCSKGRGLESDLTLEHVLPYSPNAGWQKSFGLDTYNDAIERLGNMALLTELQNRDIEQKPFNEKKTVLQASGYNINKKIAGYKTWDIDNLNAHQAWLAEQAKAVWCMS